MIMISLFINLICGKFRARRQELLRSKTAKVPIPMHLRVYNYITSRYLVTDQLNDDELDREGIAKDIHLLPTDSAVLKHKKWS
jgi:hypothetical protein